ncbi:Internalin-I [Wickerhamomyces ciferrii]|uniref:Internalin-I n=1 Tax=Wickerhamomyces ciferrii (strain ATCC 14091 / BCRC 22168 / CBS 111 / JCM 3599 / NBRC 0793 / NRRL Y-1031 F-60-10) TaxID=1206466 RepID=K0KIE5_WICCF|nr:Internalin-I [Wickerhamomyces ciferrii]CCH41169.1 Internalin-I [Wickerhamomyces ciferrii]
MDENVDYDTHRELVRDYEKREKNNTVLDPSLLKGFKGAILIEFFDISTLLRKFDRHLLLNYPIELFWHTRTRLRYFKIFTRMFETSGDRLKKINLLFETGKEPNNRLDQHYAVSNIPQGIPSNILHIPVVETLHLDKLEGYSIPDIKTSLPDLETIQIVFDDQLYHDRELELKDEYYEPTTILGCLEHRNEKSKLDEFFKTSKGESIDFLKNFQLKYFHNKKSKLFDNLQLSNLASLFIDSSTIHSIKNLDLPNLKILNIKKSAIYEISNLELNSLTGLTIDLSSPHYTLENEQMRQINVTVQNIKSSTLQDFNLTSSFKIKKISNLEFPSLTFLEIHSTTFSYSHLDKFGNILKPCDKLEAIILTNTIEILKFQMTFPNVITLSITNTNELGEFDIINIDSSFPQLEDIIIEGIPVDNLYPLFNSTSTLQTIYISSCPNFNVAKIGPQNSLGSLMLKNMKSITGFNGICLPVLTELILETSGENHLIIENCSFQILKTLMIDTKVIFYMTYEESLTFLNNEIPQLQKLIISGYKITNHFSTTPYPLLEHLKIDRLKSIEISPSASLKSINLSQNCTTMNINKSNELPNLQEYKEPKKNEILETVTKRRKVDQEDFANLLNYVKNEKGVDLFQFLPNFNMDG